MTLDQYKRSHESTALLTSSLPCELRQCFRCGLAVAADRQTSFDRRAAQTAGEKDHPPVQRLSRSASNTADIVDTDTCSVLFNPPMEKEASSNPNLGGPLFFAPRARSDLPVHPTCALARPATLAPRENRGLLGRMDGEDLVAAA